LPILPFRPDYNYPEQMAGDSDSSPHVPGAPAFSRYEIQGRVGEGTTSVIYRARDRSLQRVLALKVLKETTGFSEIGRQRFRREAQATAGLSHPNLVTVYDVGEEEGRLYFAMELVDGRPLVELLKERTLSLRELVAILEKAARGLGVAHRNGIVHRDVKPANILIGSQGEPKVGDFGLAHLIDSTTELTRSGTPMGTPLYMAPEQVEGRTKDISPRTDVFALGAILYEIAAGRPPYLAETLVELYAKIVREDPAPPRRLNPALPADLETIILKAVDREASRRYATAEEMADDMRRYLDGEPVEARAASPAYRLYRRVRKAPVVFGLAGALFCLLAASTLIWFAGGRRLKGEQELAIRTLREKAQVALDAALDLRRSGRIDLMQRYREVLESAYREAIVRAPDVAEVEYLMGRMERLLMRDDRALDYQNRALRKDPDFSPAIYERIILQSKKYGSVWLGARTREEAERIQPGLVPMREGLLKDLERLLASRPSAQLRPTHRKAAQGILAYYQSKIPEARAILEEVVREDPLLEEGWETLGLAARFEAYRAPIEQQEELYARLESYYSSALAADRGYVPLWTGRGYARTHLADFLQDRGANPNEMMARAVEDYAEAARLAPGSAEVATARGITYMLRAGIRKARKESPVDEFAKADEELARATTLDPAYSKAWFHRGRLRHLWADYARRQGEDPLPNYAEAERLLSEAARLDPYSRALQSRGEVRDERAHHFMNRGENPLPDLQAAEEDYTKALQSAGATSQLYTSRGVTRLRRARLAQGLRDLPAAKSACAAALGDFQEAIRLDPSCEARLKGGVMDEAKQLMAELQSP
jgi:tetratricopeptide (TPR) repeat protein/predicted Ser/Thr protein kinase